MCSFTEGQHRVHYMDENFTHKTTAHGEKKRAVKVRERCYLVSYS